MKTKSINILLYAIVLGIFSVAPSYANHAEIDSANQFADSGLRDVLSYGSSVTVRLNYSVGTLVAGQAYRVRYLNNGSFETCGTQGGSGQYICRIYGGANLNYYQISMWGAIFQFDDYGNVFKNGYVAGRMY